MDWFTVVMAGLGGAFGALIGALLRIFFGKKISNKTAQTALMVVPMVITLNVFQVISKNEKVHDIFIKPTKAELVGRQILGVLKENPTVNGMISKLPESQIQSFIRDKSRAGLRRLSVENLKIWHDIRIKMAERNKKVCGGFWTGKLQNDQLLAVYDSLSEEELRQFVTVTANSIIGEFENRDYDVPPVTTLYDTLKAISAELSAAEQKRFRKVLEEGVAASEDDGCWAIMKIFEKSNTLQEQQRVDLIKALASI